jgi:hypothetical protein
LLSAERKNGVRVLYYSGYQNRVKVPMPSSAVKSEYFYEQTNLTMRDFITVREKLSNSPAYLIRKMYSDPFIAGYLNKTWFLSL